MSRAESTGMKSARRVKCPNCGTEFEIPPISTDIKARREAAGLTRTAFAKAVGTSYRRLWEWEEGKRTPGPEWIARIEKALGSPRA